jgi:MoaA/NifB/PqqE/SkfB family radical SAM enzyme
MNFTYGNFFFKIPCDVQYDSTLELTTLCNFHCEYCSNGRGREHIVKTRKGYTISDVQAIINFFNQHGIWHILVGGGEASTHPFFYELLNQVKIKHYISIYTNLSFDVETFTKKLDPHHIITIRCTLHEPCNENIFFSKLQLLHNAGYNPSMVIVATPERFQHIDALISRAVKLTIPISVFPLAGPFRGKNYPTAYTEAEKRFLLDRATGLLYPGHIVRLMTGKEGLNNIGQPCQAGKNFFSIHAEKGNIMRCSGIHTPVGNIYSGEFQPYSSDNICTSTTCIDYCFRDDLGIVYNKNFFTTPLCPQELLEISNNYGIESHEILEKIRINYLTIVHTKISGRRILVWGAGMAGSFFYEAYRNIYSTDNIIGFIDTNKEKNNRKIFDKSVYEPYIVNKLKIEMILICAPAFEDEIFGIISEMNLDSSITVLGMVKDITKGFFYVF